MSFKMSLKLKLIQDPLSISNQLLKDTINEIDYPKITDVDEFVSSSEKIWRNLALALQWIRCSEWVPSEWESKQLIKTSQKSTSNPHNFSPSIHILWSEKLWVCNKSSVLTLNHHFWPNYQSIITLTPVKKSILFCPHTSKSTNIFYLDDVCL